MSIVSMPRKYLRRFTEEDDRILREDYHAHVPMLEIARKLRRDEGTVRQRILRLRLRRSSVVTRMLGWAPEHLKSQLAELGTEKFIAACYAWRDERAAESARQTATETEAEQAAIAKAAAEIDAQHDISRDHKMIAKRMAGMKLQDIAAQHGVTWQRVQQITEPAHVSAARTNSLSGLSGLAAKIEKLEMKRELLIDAQVARLVSAWNASPQSVKDEFLKRIGAALSSTK
jgi:hypothetical protein